MSFSSYEFSRTIDVTSVKKHKRYRLNATREQCRALARRFGVQDIVFLNAVVDVEKDDQGVIKVKGHFESEVVQTCIVTLDPVISVVIQDFKEKLKTVLVPEVSSEVFFTTDTLEADFVEGNLVDIGEIVAQNLALAINPYPRSDQADVFMGEWKNRQPTHHQKIHGPFSDADLQNPFERLKRMLKK